ncbi:MAG: hypothetical protein AAGC74_10820, partial [Verrucomicrobiota bacterium]
MTKLFTATLATLTLSTTAWAQIIDWANGIVIASSADSEITSVDSQPNQVASGGWFEGTIPNLSGTGGVFFANNRDGFVRLESRPAAGPPYLTDFVAHVFSNNGSCEVRDVRFGPNGNIWVGGKFNNDVTFTGLGTLTAGSNDEGFVAEIGSSNGTWIRAWKVSEMTVESLLKDDNDTLFVTGEGDLLRCYTDNGNLLWSRATDSTEVTPLDLAGDIFNPGAPIYLGGEQSGTLNNQFGQSRIRMSYPDQAIAPNITSELILNTSASIDFEIAISFFNGGEVTFTANNTATINALSIGSRAINQPNPNELQISGGNTEDPGSEAVISFTGITNLTVSVLYDSDSRGINGDFDYLFNIFEFTDSSGTIYPWADQAFVGSFKTDPFSVSTGNLSGSGITATFSEGPSWGLD